MIDLRCIMVTGALAGLLFSGSACSSAEAPTPRGSGSRTSLDAPEGGFPEVDAGVDSGDTFDGPGGSCKLTRRYGSPECIACVTDRCCAPIAACEANAVCNALHACITDCMSTPDVRACYLDCNVQHPGVKDLWAPVESCWFYTACGDPCPLDHQ